MFYTKQAAEPRTSKTLRDEYFPAGGGDAGSGKGGTTAKSSLPKSGRGGAGAGVGVGVPRLSKAVDGGGSGSKGLRKGPSSSEGLRGMFFCGEGETRASGMDSVYSNKGLCVLLVCAS